MRHRHAYTLFAAAALAAALAAGSSAPVSATPIEEGTVLLSAVSATGAGSTFSPNVNRQEVGYAQVTITGTATCAIEGRLNSSGGWITLYTFTSSGMAQVPRVGDVRANVTSYTSGTVSAWFSP